MDISMYNIIYSQELGVILYNYMYWVFSRTYANSKKKFC